VKEVLIDKRTARWHCEKPNGTMKDELCNDEAMKVERLTKDKG